MEEPKDGTTEEPTDGRTGMVTYRADIAAKKIKGREASVPF